MPEKWLKWENGKEWGTLYCPMLEKEIMTYWPGGPAFYSYTAPFVDDGDVCYYRYDHDEGGWDEKENICSIINSDDDGDIPFRMSVSSPELGRNRKNRTGARAETGDDHMEGRFSVVPYTSDARRRRSGNAYIQ